MNKKSAILVLAALILAVGLACDMSSLTQTDEQKAQTGQVLFRDDFSVSSSGWSSWSSPKAEVAYQDGGLHFSIHDTNFDYWSRPGKRFSNVRIAVESMWTDGSQDNEYGILCRYQNQDNYYAFLISSDGYGGILKVKNGQYGLIHAKTMDFSESLQQGKNLVNYIGAECSGTSLSLFANGVKIASASDQDFRSGEVGLIAGTNQAAGVEILFDNFVVSKY